MTNEELSPALRACAFTEQELHLLIEACALHREKFTNGYAMTLLQDKLRDLRAQRVADSACCPPPSAATPDGDAPDRSSLSSFGADALAPPEPPEEKKNEDLATRVDGL